NFNYTGGCVGIYLRNSAGAQLNSLGYCGGTSYFDTTVLPPDGSYTLHRDPSGFAVGSLTVALTTVAPDFTGSIGTDGTPVTVTTSLGQGGDLTLTGSAGQRV